MNRTSLKGWLVFGTAAIAAAITDPLIEFCSNAGYFGRGDFTDHSNLNVVPMLVIGFCFIVVYYIYRVRSLLGMTRSPQNTLRACNEALDAGVYRFLPLIFALQIAILFGMESAEQCIVWGHLLGGTIWLGAPILASLAIHAFACCSLALAATRVVRSLASTTLRLIMRIVALVTLPNRDQTTIRPYLTLLSAPNIALALCGIGERAPPVLQS